MSHRKPHAVRAAAAALVILAAGCRETAPPAAPRYLPPQPAPTMATPRTKDLTPDGAGIGTLSSMMMAWRANYSTPGTPGVPSRNGGASGRHV